MFIGSKSGLSSYQKSSVFNDYWYTRLFHRIARLLGNYQILSYNMHFHISTFPLRRILFFGVQL